MNDNKINPVPEMDPQLESAVWSVVSEPLDAAAIERVKTNAKKIASDSQRELASTDSKTPASKLAVNSENETGQIKRSSGWIAKLAIAALVLVAVGVATFFPTSQGSAFAAAMEKLRTAKAFSFDQIVYLDDQEEPFKSHVIYAADGRHREESEVMIRICDTAGSLRLTLFPDDASPTAFTTKPFEGAEPFNQLEWLEDFKSYTDKPSKDLGEKEFDGKTARGFEVLIADFQSNIWIDKDTQELCQIELIGEFGKNKAGKMVYTNFNFDEQIDDALFSLEVPDGYENLDATFERAQAALANPEQTVVDALRGLAELSDGKFPQSLTVEECVELVTEVEVGDGPSETFLGNIGYMMSFMIGLKDENAELDQDNLEIIENVVFVMSFLNDLKDEDFEYLGGGMTLDQDELEIVLWYRQDGKARAIYSDLSVSDVEDADLPEKAAK